MLSKSDVPLIKVMKELATDGIQAGYLVPTPTGLDKSILDAHEGVRLLLSESGIHDYSTQGQGQDAKVIVKGYLVGSDSLTETKISLYRPPSKDGDPRLWISGLPGYAAPWNLLVLIPISGEIYVVNASRKEVFDSRHRTGSPFRRLLGRASPDLDASEAELLEMLKQVAARNFVDTLRAGPTGVGMTLETLLGIAANSRREPDFKGIEIKASRTGRPATQPSPVRVNLFSQVPDWKRSALTSGVKILQAHGYNDPDSGRLQFYCQLGTQPNSLGHFLKVEEATGLLRSRKRAPDGSTADVVCWSMEKLREQLHQKHARTFWVKARTRFTDQGTEQFHYVEAVRTLAPMSSNFATLIEIDAISFDFTLSMIDGKRGPRARDHGYLFKIHPSNLDLLFPKSEPISLL